jgi:hypothetical protein
MRYLSCLLCIALLLHTLPSSDGYYVDLVRL